MRPEHVPVGDPCKRCKLPSSVHRIRLRADTRIRPEHTPVGDPCLRCGQPAHSHRSRGYRIPRPSFSPRNNYRTIHCVGIDGEGQGRDNHKYTLLAGSTSDGKIAGSVENINGLDTIKCLDFFLSFPNNTRLFAYSFNYDLTMMLRDLPNEHIYFLFHPELRKRRKRPELGPLPIFWEGYHINLQGTKFFVKKNDNQRVVWDIWKFYQGRFTKALEQWNIANDEREYIEKLKLQRGHFDQLDFQEVKKYCFTECRYLAELAQKLIDAHTSAGLKLTSFYGAGSTGAAILKQMGARDFRADPPKEVEPLIARSFFGGRFENLMIGELKETVYSYDISSAYPYQLYFLPCLKHAKWEHISDRSKLSPGTKGTALVRYRLHPTERVGTWGPFPFRLDNGSICFPASSGGGWIWQDEYLAGEALFPNVEFIEAWKLHCECDCIPFEKIPHYYLERIRIGKEGAGWVFKLGPNSCYGKLAQSVGNGPFTCWTWASLVTSNTRAQLLRAMGTASSLGNILLVATDGIHSRERLFLEKPRETGTSHVPKPLGGWEEKRIDYGVFYARPGIYFPLNVDIEAVRARGLGRNVLHDNKQAIIDAWNTAKETGEYNKTVTIGNIVRFLGAKSSISIKEGEFMRSLDYGQWRKRPIDLSFNPEPKRSAINPDGTLTLRSFPMTQESVPYDRALSPDSILPMLRKIEMEEQPDLSLGVYDADEG